MRHPPTESAGKKIKKMSRAQVGRFCADQRDGRRPGCRQKIKGPRGPLALSAPIVLARRPPPQVFCRSAFRIPADLKPSPFVAVASTRRDRRERKLWLPVDSPDTSRCARRSTTTLPPCPPFAVAASAGLPLRGRELRSATNPARSPRMAGRRLDRASFWRRSLGRCAAPRGLAPPGPGGAAPWPAAAKAARVDMHAVGIGPEPF